VVSLLDSAGLRVYLFSHTTGAVVTPGLKAGRFNPSRPK
jgi:hypothetical protein